MKAEIKLEAVPEGSKVKLRDHLMQVWKTLKRKPVELEEQPEFPEELRYIYNWYLEMRSADHLSYNEIECWGRLTSQTLLAWEVDLVRTMDRLYWSMQ